MENDYLQIIIKSWYLFLILSQNNNINHWFKISKFMIKYCEYKIHFSLFIFDSLYLFICIYLILIWFLYWYEDDRLILIVLINWVCNVYDFLDDWLILIMLIRCICKV